MPNTPYMCCDALRVTFHTMTQLVQVVIVVLSFIIMLSPILAFRSRGFLPSRLCRASHALQNQINGSVEKDKDKVVNNLEVKAGEKCVLCRCWKSGTFPLCDGSHMKHNKETGDNVGPVIVSVAK